MEMIGLENSIKALQAGARCNCTENAGQTIQDY